MEYIAKGLTYCHYPESQGEPSSKDAGDSPGKKAGDSTYRKEIVNTIVKQCCEPNVYHMLKLQQV